MTTTPPDPVPPVDYPTPVPSPSDLVVSYLRTVVPVLWGSGLTWLATRLPEVAAALDNPTVLTAVTGAAVALWYALWRAVEPRLPAWLTRLFLGSNREPNYRVPPAVR